METCHPVYNCFEVDANGLPKILHDIPDTSVMDFYRGLNQLDDSQCQKAINIAISHANQFVEAILDPSNYSRPTKPESLQHVNDLGSTHCEAKDISIKLLKQLVGAMKSDKPGAKSMLGDYPVDPVLIKYADSLEPIKAVEMRKRLKCYLGDQFGLVAQNQGSGVWQYRSDCRKVVLEIDYGGSWGQQLRYCILHPKAKRLTLEMLWGIGDGDWDYLHRDNFESSIAALGSIYSFFDHALCNEQASAID